MLQGMSLGHKIESHKFWDIVMLWAKERLENESLVARALAAAVIRDGLILNSTDPKWLKADDGRLELRGTPYVGYDPLGMGETMILKAETLEHLLSIVGAAKEPDKLKLSDEFIFRSDFARWLVWSGEEWPHFWFPEGKEKIAL
jgi:hypothetical protein